MFFKVRPIVECEDTEAVMVKKRTNIIPALILLAAVLAVLADPAPAATLMF